MLGCNPVRQGGGLRQITHHDHRVIIAQLAPAMARRSNVFQTLAHGICHSAAKALIGGNQDGLRRFVMLGLAEQVPRAIQSGSLSLSAITKISDGPAIMSMPTRPNTRPLGGGNIGIARPVILSTGAMVSVP